MEARNHGQRPLDDYLLEGTDETLTADLRTAGALSFTGVSLCVNPTEVYSGVLEWVRAYVKQPAPRTHVLFSIHYFNTSTSKVILEILQLLEGMQRKGGEVEVHWRYRALVLDMEDAGAGYAENTVLRFYMEQI